MFGNKENNIEVLDMPRPHECGGTYATLDKSAPKDIKSHDMIFFSATSALNSEVMKNSIKQSEFEWLCFVSAFAAKCDKGTFLFLETRNAPRRFDSAKRLWAFVKDDIFPTLDKLVREYDIVSNNGYHSETYGLPENFGGSVDIKYASGEKISFSNNQTPIIKSEAGLKIAEIFGEYINREKVTLPDISGLKEICFSEERKDGGYVKANLTLNSDGTGINRKSYRFDDGKVYESEKPVEAGTVSTIKDVIKRAGLLAWAGLPKSNYPHYSEKSLTFIFNDKSEITVYSNTVLPPQISGGFFDIEIEIATKN